MSAEGKMKAVHYEGPFKVSVKEVDTPKIEHPDDVIIKVTTACKCLQHVLPQNIIYLVGSYES
jgi:hypothetical protein